MPALEARGVEIAWWERGSGAPFLLIHDTATTAAVWEAAARAISEDGRAIAYDRRGWGASGSPDGYRRTTVEEQSEDAAALAGSLELEPVVACGAGAGAIVALDLLLRRPELVRAAVLIEPPLLQLLPSATEALSADRGRLEVAAASGEDVIELILSGVLPALGPGVARLPAELGVAARERPASVVAELGLASGWRLPLARLAEAERPSVIVTCDSTPPLVREGSAALAARLAGSEARQVDSGAPPPPLGAAEELAAIAVELSR
jgi:pimeloyl-ACP methyl ester carboxylesterase